MAETQLKRQRDETQIEDIDETKRHKSYNHILSILEEEEDEPTQDLSYLITTLQQELSSSPTQTIRPNQDNSASAATAAVADYPSSTSSSSSSSAFLKEEEEDDKERVIRHLLEASDDELGIPNREIVNGVDEYGYEEEFVSSENGLNGSDVFSLCDGLWEFEDVNANYYTLLQSELFM